MQSKWLTEQECIVNEFRAKKRGQFPMVVGMVCFMVLLFAVMGYINSDTLPKENISIMLKTLGLLIGVIVLVLLLATRFNNKKGLPNLRKSLEKILTSKEEINQFDAEMKSPLHRVELKDDYGEYFFTKQYLVSKYGKIPLTSYNVFKLSQIDSTKTICLRDRSNVLRKQYFTNLCDENRKVLGGITIRRRAEYEEFIENLQHFVPDVKLGQGR